MECIDQRENNSTFVEDKPHSLKVLVLLRINPGENCSPYTLPGGFQSLDDEGDELELVVGCFRHANYLDRLAYGVRLTPQAIRTTG